MLKYLIALLLISTPVNASHLIVQSHDISTIYGDSIASYYGRTTLFKVRDTSTDKYDNTKHILNKVLQKSSEYDNLMLIGFDGDLPTNINVFGPAYRDFVVNTIKEFYPDDAINVVCNSLCLNVGTIHRVNNSRELRKLLLTLDGVVVNSLTTLWDEDRHSYLRGDDLTHVFLVSKQFTVSALYADNNTHLQFWIDPIQIVENNLSPNARIKLDRVKTRRDFKRIINVVSKLNLKAK